MPSPTSPRPRRVPGRRVGVALIDGTPLIREGIAALVRRTPGLQWLGSAENARIGQRLCDQLRPDVVLVDANLDPRGSLGQQLVAANPDLTVLLLIDGAQRTTQYLATALSGGVRGAILRSTQPTQLLAAIKSVHADGRYLDAALAPNLAVPSARQPNGHQQPLSQREHQVLQLIADGLENQAIANVLYVSVETVRTHVKSILRKLASRDRTHAVAVAFRSGVLSVDGSIPESRSARD